MTKEELKEYTIKAIEGVDNSVEGYKDFLNVMKGFIGTDSPLINKFERIISKFQHNYQAAFNQLVDIIYKLPDDETNKSIS